MVKTTLYLPESLKAELERVARTEQRSEAEIIREALAGALRARQRPKPRMPLFHSGDPTLAHRTDDLLEGFGDS